MSAPHIDAAIERATLILDGYPMAKSEASTVDKILTDLRHFCDAEGISFHERQARAYAIYLSECNAARSADDHLKTKNQKPK